MKVLEQANKFILNVLKVLMVLLFVFMIVSLSIQVFGRYVFKAGLPWTEEIGRYSMIWMVFLGVPYIALKSEHINVSLIQDMLKGIPKKVLLIFQNAVSLIFAGLLLYYSFDAIEITSMSVSTNTGLRMSTIYLIFPISMILIIWSYIYRILKNLVSLNDKDDKSIEGGMNK